MIINIKHKIIICWLMLLAGMILHFNYHVSGIFYGIDVKKPGADGTVPDTLLLIRTVFYHLPFIYILLIMYMDKILWAITFLVISVIYLLANLLHVVKEIMKSEDYSQIMLLSVVFVVSIFLVKENYNWVKSFKKTE